MILKELKAGLVHLFYPRLCEGCNKALLHEEQVLCLSCLLELPFTNYHHIADNETAMRFAGRVPFEHATSLAYFTNEGLLQHLLHRLKYNGRKEVGIFLGRQLGVSINSVDWINTIDMIVPVPLHIKKEQNRGYNQSELIARGISEVTRLPVSSSNLYRRRYTESQTQKTRSERIENMREAFELKMPEHMKGKHVLLIDDVLTTGATLEACARSILACANARVSFCTVGIASY